MQPFRYEGEFILSQPKDILVEDFIALRKTSKGRRFVPYLRLRIDEFDVVLDGYDAIWEFFDVIQPNMYRTMIQAGMLGKLDLPHSFREEIQILIDESQIEWVCFQYDKKPFVVPNTRPKETLEAHTCVSVWNCTMKDDNAPSLGYISRMWLPFNSNGKKQGFSHFVPSYVYGEHPQMCIAQELKTDDLWRVATIIYANNGADYRIAPNKYFTMYGEFTRMGLYIIQMSVHMAEVSYDITNTLPNKDKTGMYSRERDKLEYDRYIFQIGGKN